MAVASSAPSSMARLAPSPTNGVIRWAASPSRVMDDPLKTLEQTGGAQRGLLVHVQHPALITSTDRRVEFVHGSFDPMDMQRPSKRQTTKTRANHDDRLML